MLYPAIYQGPPNGYSHVATDKKYLAVHNTSNPTSSAQNEADYARVRTDNVSSHYYADKIEVIQSLDTRYCAWHAGSSSGNTRAISYEICGLNSWTRAQWLARVDWDKLATQMAKDCTAHGITVQALTNAQIKAGTMTGVITHKQMGEVWGGTDHTDPGPNFPMDHLIAKIKEKMGGPDVADVTKADLVGVDDQRLAALTTRSEAFMRGTIEYDATWTADPKDKEKSWGIAQLHKIDQVLTEVGKDQPVILTEAQLEQVIDGVAKKLIAELQLTFVPAPPE